MKADSYVYRASICLLIHNTPVKIVLAKISGMRLKESNKPCVKLIYHIQYLNQIVVAYILLLTTRDSACRTNDVLDLPSVHFLLPKLV